MNASPTQLSSFTHNNSKLNEHVSKMWSDESGRLKVSSEYRGGTAIYNGQKNTVTQRRKSSCKRWWTRRKGMRKRRGKTENNHY